MTPTHSLLKRQVKRCFGRDFIIPADWEDFVAAVDSAYAESEVDRRLTEHSLEVCSQELLEANSEIRAIFQAVPDLVFRLDLEGRIMAVKAGAGGELPSAKLLGQRIQDCWLKDTGGAFSAMLRQVVADRTMVSIEHTERAEGFETSHEIRLVPLLSDQVVAIARDITERKRGEAKLNLMHAQLVDASRRAGMAEIANNVLHNVGNVLNSVNVSAGLIADRTRHSRAEGLAKAVALMTEHAADLGEFLTLDPRGKALPGYLAKLVAVLAAERQSVAQELDSLAKGIDHIKDIVATQQSYSGTTSLVESVQISDLMDDALRINAASMARHHIMVNKEYADLPLMMLDKHLLLQILVNLIGNAKHAMDGMPDRAHQITLRTEVFGPADSRQLRLRVEDDGEGIAPESLARLFTHGFTTRKNGHGFGLHSCALAAKEMAGVITAGSAGLGKGATFTLELPVNPAQVQQ